MAILVDDVLTLPVSFLKLVFDTVIQTAYKTAWAQYRQDLTVSLLHLKRDYREGRVSREEMRAVEKQIFAELRLARKVLMSSSAS